MRSVTPSKLCTVIENADGVSVSTIEHLMAALAGSGIHNALIEIDGPEVPILDGSAAALRRGLPGAGHRASRTMPVRAIRVLKPVEVRDGEAVARLEPAEMLEIDFRIDFDRCGDRHADPAAEHGQRRLCARTVATAAPSAASPMSMRCAARVWPWAGRWKTPWCLTATRCLSPGGLRHADEPVRHKMLDALGDLALAGGPILGRYTGDSGGPCPDQPAVARTFRRSDGLDACVDCGPQTLGKLPGVGVHAGDLPVLA